MFKCFVRFLIVRICRQVNILPWFIVFVVFWLRLVIILLRVYWFIIRLITFLFFFIRTVSFIFTCFIFLSGFVIFCDFRIFWVIWIIRILWFRIILWRLKCIIRFFTFSLFLIIILVVSLISRVRHFVIFSTILSLVFCVLLWIFILMELHYFLISMSIDIIAL